MTKFEKFLFEQKFHSKTEYEINELILSIILAAKFIQHKINSPKFKNILKNNDNNINIQGEIQMKLDQYANNKFKHILKFQKNVAGLVSEEEENIIIFDNDRAKKAKYIILIDPLDGSSNIDVNIPIGTIFSIYQRVTPIGFLIDKNDFLQPGNKQIAAGYILYGASTILVFTTGYGVNIYTYDSSLGVFILSQKKIIYPQKDLIYSINESNYFSFSKEIKKYIKYCQKQNKIIENYYISRYVGSLVADFHRNLIKGGIYIYPNTIKYPTGKLRLLYECNPIAFLAEQAEGKASNGTSRILDIIPNKLHQRSQLIVGTKSMVNKVEYFINKL
ncbi:class 1 fructose-bisphosphatase [Candidatus Providencia siddallii]|uniref:Fructose-1,6-bisphosphatase class 1 n=1 Tax=Candidatus Providencia siddallii TaxID=1715285 RepID=A0ABM9NPD2_9GAMM